MAVSERMTALGYEVRTMADEGEAPYVVFIRGHGRKVDVLRAETEYQLLAIDRAIDGVLSPEDVIVHKLLACNGAVDPHEERKLQKCRLAV